MYQVMQTLGNGQSALPSVLLRREGGKAYWVKWTMLQWTHKERAVTHKRPCRYKSTNLVLKKFS